MKRHALGAFAATVLLCGTAFAQTVVISPEQETVIHKYVTTHTVAPVEVQGVDVAVGATLPDTVELHRVDVPDVNYSYVVVDGQTLLVEPDTRKVIKVIKD